jgi:bacillithiol biosynthesis cysteine-adding enzyme BshC
VPDHTTSSLHLPVDVRRFPWIRRLAADYAYSYDALAPFFAGNPAERAAWDAAVAAAQAYRRPRGEIAAIVMAEQRRRGAAPAAMASAERLGDERAVAVVTGQQAGLFGGPLFTLLKAITAIKLAAQVEREHRVPAVPVFWIDAEDHDWDEVSGCTVLGDDLEPRTIRLPAPPGSGGLPVAAARLTPAAMTAVDELQAALAATEFTGTLLSELQSAYRPGAGMADAFGRWMELVLGGHGLVVFDSSDPAAKTLAAPVFARELETPGTTSRLASEAAAHLVARGYHAQATAHEGALALFHLDGARTPIRLQGDRAVVGDGVRSTGELRAELRTHPEAFSPNVLLRPIVQDALFPTAAYVAGPNELAYLAQLRLVYAHFGVPMPLMAPRSSATLLDAAAARFMRRYEIPFEALEPNDESALNRLLESQLPPAIERALQAATGAIEERMHAVIDALPALDPTLQGAARSTLGRMQHDLEVLHGKIIHAVKRRDDTLRRQFNRTRALAFPGGHPQERAVGFVYFLNRYGPALVERLLADLPIDPRHHYALTI